jgi:hypothetical protein
MQDQGFQHADYEDTFFCHCCSGMYASLPVFKRHNLLVTVLQKCTYLPHKGIILDYNQMSEDSGEITAVNMVNTVWVSLRMPHMTYLT